jgi:hypothetical protein
MGTVQRGCHIGLLDCVYPKECEIPQGHAGAFA